MRKKVMIGMSGGVDSSVAAALLDEEGYDVSGVTLKLFSKEDTCDKSCSAGDDVDAKRVAEKMGFEHYVVNLEKDFGEKVIAKFVDSYIHGKTPNPCIDCNKHIKFGKMLEYARTLGNEYIATGHYAQIEYDEKSGRYLLKKAADESKDQTYVLYNMTQDELAHTFFPLGAYTKAQVRDMAEKRGLVNAKKPDSQDICFVPDGDYAAFIERACKKTFAKGDFVDTEGNVLGRHSGIINYTIGQRKGLGITFGEPRYVVKKDAEKNTVMLGVHEELFSDTLIACDANWISIEKPEGKIRVQAKARYKQQAVWATVSLMDDGRVLCVFDEPQRAISPGQAVVFYDGDYVVGGATIE